MAIYTLLGWQLGIVAWTLLWQALVILHNFGGWGRWGPTKNLVMGGGAVAHLAAAWQLIGPIDDTGWRWITVISVTLGALGVHMQDLRGPQRR